MHAELCVRCSCLAWLEQFEEENGLKVLIELTFRQYSNVWEKHISFWLFYFIRQLSDNEIHTVEKGSFQDLASLERM